MIDDGCEAEDCVHWAGPDGAGFTKRLTRLGYSVMGFDLEIDRMAAASIWTEAVTFCFALSRRKSSGR